MRLRAVCGRGDGGLLPIRPGLPVSGDGRYRRGQDLHLRRDQLRALRRGLRAHTRDEGLSQRLRAPQCGDGGGAEIRARGKDLYRAAESGLHGAQARWQRRSPASRLGGADVRRRAQLELRARGEPGGSGDPRPDCGAVRSGGDDRPGRVPAHPAGRERRAPISFEPAVRHGNLPGHRAAAEGAQPGGPGRGQRRAPAVQRRVQPGAAGGRRGWSAGNADAEPRARRRGDRAACGANSSGSGVPRCGGGGAVPLERVGGRAAGGAGAVGCAECGRAAPARGGAASKNGDGAQAGDRAHAGGAGRCGARGAAAGRRGAPAQGEGGAEPPFRGASGGEAEVRADGEESDACV